MLRRIALILAAAAVIAPAAARAHEWEEDYTDDGSSYDSGDYPVSVDADADSAPVNIETFQGSLAPYGEWVVAGSYGRVWRPHVAAGWRPYYYGRWEWTNEGWLWVSDEPWGWAAYHYGRWTTDPYYGWIWVPGYQWAPAWVSWRYSGDVVGWAPLGPGVSVYVGVTPYVESWWTFVPCHSFVAQPVYRVAYQPGFTRRYFYSTAPAPARQFRPGYGGVHAPAWGGPPPRTIEQRLGRTLTPVRVVPSPTPGAARVANGEVSMYRPGLRGFGSRAAPAPRDGFRNDEARRGAPALRHDDARSSPPARDPGRVEPGRGDRGHAWGLPSPQGAQPQQQQHFQPGPTPVPRQESGPAPRGWGGGAPAQQGSPRPAAPSPSPAPRSDRAWGVGGGGWHPGGGAAPAPRAAVPVPRGGGDGGRWHR